MTAQADVMAPRITRPSVTGRLALSLGAALALGAIAGYLLTPRDETEVVQVNVRSGEPVTNDQVDAVVRIHSDIVEAAVEEALREADMPFEMDDIEVESTVTGLQIRSRLGFEALGVRVRGRFSTDAHPLAESDGTVGIELTSTRVVGARVPAVVERTLRSIVSERVSDATQLEGYRVVAVETSEQELIVHLKLTEPFDLAFEE